MIGYLEMIGYFDLYCSRKMWRWRGHVDKPTNSWEDHAPRPSLFGTLKYLMIDYNATPIHDRNGPVQKYALLMSDRKGWAQSVPRWADEDMAKFDITPTPFGSYWLNHNFMNPMDSNELLDHRKIWNGAWSGRQYQKWRTTR